VLQWAREHGCPWNEWTCRQAAYGGHLEMLQWLREHGCPWDWKRCREAAVAVRHLEMQQWLMEHRV